MAYQIDEEEFSDNGFDELPANALYQLEHEAVSQRGPEIYDVHDQHAAFVDDGGLYQGNAEMYDQQTAAEDETMAEPPSSDYGFDDEDVIDLDEPTMVIHPASGLPSRSGRQDKSNNNHHTADAQPEVWTQQEHLHHAQQRATDIDVTGLQMRIAELEREQAKLQKSAEDAKTDALSKAGAIAILRSKHDKATKEYERKLSVMQSLHAEETAKQKAEIEAARKERETVKTSNRFLEHDLAQEVERAKRLKGPANQSNVRNGSRAENGTATTPQKAYSLPHRDGFDDDEIITYSPSRSRDRGKSGTPKAGAKRKRPVDASPIPLLITEARASPMSEGRGTQALEEEEVKTLKGVDRRDAGIRVMQRVLNHAPDVGHVRTLEALVQFAFPSMPEQSISSHLLQGLSDFSQDSKHGLAALHVCSNCMDLWERCLQETYYEPLYLILDLFEFVLVPEVVSVRTMVLDRFIPLATKTIDLIAVPLATASRNTAYAESIDKAVQTKLQEEIDIYHVLSLLHMLAMSASLDSGQTKLFWEAMEFDFVLMMLNKAQQLPQINLVLQMVASSILPDSFGTIRSDLQRQSKDESGTIDRLTSLFFEYPDPPPGEEPYDTAEICQLRLEILRTLRSICLTDHGSVALAQHRSAIGRLIRFLDLQVTSLYSIPPDQVVFVDGQLIDVPQHQSIHGLTVTSINLTTRLLYHLLHNHAEIIDFREKLAIIPGGYHKFLVAFTRLAFSEQLVYEAGIDEEVVDAAHEILDAVLDPEAGDAVVKAVETPSRSNTARTSVPGGSAPG